MIDIEKLIYTPIAEALRKRFKGIAVSGEYVNAPPKFPYVSIVEQDNYMPANRLDSSDREKFSTLMYEVNVYSDKAGSKKSVCREIMGVIDEMVSFASRSGSTLTFTCLEDKPTVDIPITVEVYV